MAFNYKLGTHFSDVCANMNIGKDDEEKIRRVCLIKDGYTEKALCYIAARYEDKLTKFIGDSRFASVFINEVHKNALKPGDERWNKKR